MKFGKISGRPEKAILSKNVYLLWSLRFAAIKRTNNIIFRRICLVLLGWAQKVGLGQGLDDWRSGSAPDSGGTGRNTTRMLTGANWFGWKKYRKIISAHEEKRSWLLLLWPFQIRSKLLLGTFISKMATRWKTEDLETSRGFKSSYLELR